MTTLTLRATKGSPLTNNEGDANFTNLNLSKIEIGGDLSGTTSAPIVAKLYGRSLNSSEGTTGSIIVWNGSSYVVTSSISVSSISAVLTITQNNPDGKGFVITGKKHINGVEIGEGIGSGIENTLLGDACLESLTTGNANAAMGFIALGALTTGSDNVAMGFVAGVELTTGSSNVFLGSDVQPSIAGAVNQIVIGQGITGQGDNYLTFGKPSNIVYNQFTVNATWTRSSDQRLKRNIIDDALGLSFINKLRPVTYQWRPSDEVPEELVNYYDPLENRMNVDVVMHGLIAQEVKMALDAENAPNFAGWHQQDDGVQGISYEMFIMPLISAVRELSSSLTALAARVTILETP